MEPKGLQLISYLFLNGFATFLFSFMTGGVGQVAAQPLPDRAPSSFAQGEVS
jgi:hypothetical protein